MSEPITQAQDHDRRIGRLEGIAEQLDRRLDDLQRTMTARMNGIERAIADLTCRTDSQFRWLVGILFGVVGLQLTILLKILN